MLNSMLKVDFRRMFTTSRFYIMLGISFIIPILVLVMTSTVGAGSGLIFDNAWKIIGSVSSGNPLAMMDMTTMMNINLTFFFAGIFTCLFVSDDFRSGYVKNLFTIRSNNKDYVTSKTIVSFVSCVLFLLAFFIGGILGGKIAGLSFDLAGFGISGLAMSMIAKAFLMLVFVSISVLVSSFGKQRSWLSILLFLLAGMLLFMMIPMLTPLNSGIMNVGLCLIGGIVFAIGIGFVSNVILLKEDLI